MVRMEIKILLRTITTVWSLSVVVIQTKLNLLESQGMHWDCGFLKGHMTEHFCKFFNFALQLMNGVKLWMKCQNEWRSSRHLLENLLKKGTKCEPHGLVILLKLDFQLHEHLHHQITNTSCYIMQYHASSFILFKLWTIAVFVSSTSDKVGQSQYVEDLETLEKRIHGKMDEKVRSFILYLLMCFSLAWSFLSCIMIICIMLSFAHSFIH